MKTIKHIQSLLVIIIASMTFGSCSNELNVTKSFPFNVETMPVPKELSQVFIHSPSGIFIPFEAPHFSVLHDFSRSFKSV